MSVPFAVPDNDTTPWPLDFERLLKTMNDMDYAADILVPGKAAGAVFDKVPFLFSIDSTGRFLSIRAIWDTGMTPAEVSSWVFAACDSWNREKYFPTMYWVNGEDGHVQICADFAVDTAAGLSNVQLKDNLAAGLSTGITAIEYIQQACEQCGTGDTTN
ncbi:YbjN domain-containing protein [Schaalia suimastitidis]|uniref:YbjN domain-containing protein n=1 Tax=Schaalia suimastitidis TaxID=121163 RepID=UPI00042149E3|nr:YbjN domain-containing protein [Schaalia suimastitidis]